MQSQLTDLDGLIIRVRDPGSRDLIQEAMAAYRAGALRSSIILCWVAVFSDLIAKIRELGDGGNRAARAYSDELDRNIDDPRKALKFEREIVEKATSAFLMCDSRDKTMFERLREDRNACAHPVLAGDNSHFKPTPELVRVHLAHSLDRLLVRRPAQGKEALIRLWRDLDDAVLPSDWRTAVALIYDRYVEHGTETLRRAIARGAIRGLLHRDDPFDLRDHPSYEEGPILLRRRGLLACLEAIGRVDQSVVDEATNEYLVTLEASGERVAQLTALLAVVWKSALWGRLSEPLRGQIKQIVSSLSKEPGNDTTRKYLVPALGCISVPELAEPLSSLIVLLEDTEISEVVVFEQLPTELKEILFERFEGAGNFRRAEALFDTCVLPMKPYLTKMDVGRLLDAIVANEQILYAGGMQLRVQQFFSWLWQTDRNRVDRDKWARFWGCVEREDRNNRYGELREALMNAGIV